MPGSGDRRQGGTRRDNSRRERLAAELRANLKRRKARERAHSRVKGEQQQAHSGPPKDEDHQ